MGSNIINPTGNTSNPNGGGPLAALESAGYNFSSFTYPIDLSGDPGEYHFVIFYINESNNTQFATLSKNGQGGTATSGSFTPLGPNGQPATATINSPDNATTYSKRPITRVASAIALYMPPNFQTTYATNWDQVDGNALMGAIEAFKNAGEGTSIGRMLKEVGIGIASNAAKDSQDFLAGIGISAPVEDGVSFFTRAVRNPHSEMLFRSIGFREFQFDYKFTARSEQECIVVKNIIDAFPFYMLPEVKVGSNSPRYYIYPAEFDIEFWSNGQKNQFVNKISTCALTSVNINWNGSGQWSAFRPGNIVGAPVEVNMSLTFKELEIITKNRKLQGY